MAKRDVYPRSVGMDETTPSKLGTGGARSRHWGHSQQIPRNGATAYANPASTSLSSLGLDCVQGDVERATPAHCL
jgi:hypothetical protein